MNVKNEKQKQTITIAEAIDNLMDKLHSSLLKASREHKENFDPTYFSKMFDDVTETIATKYLSIPYGRPDMLIFFGAVFQACTFRSVCEFWQLLTKRIFSVIIFHLRFF